MFRSVLKLGNLIKAQPQAYLSFSKMTYQPLYFFSNQPQQKKDLDPRILDEIETKIFSVLRTSAKCKVDKLSRSATLEELGFDSLDTVEIVVSAEENMGVDINDDEAEKVRTVQDLIQVFYKYKTEKPVASEEKKA